MTGESKRSTIFSASPSSQATFCCLVMSTVNPGSTRAVSMIAFMDAQSQRRLGRYFDIAVACPGMSNSGSTVT